MDDLVCFIGQKAFIEKDGELLVLHDTQMGWDLPGGKVLEGETDLGMSLQREVKEETGLEIVVGRPFYTWFFTILIDSGHRSAGKKIFNTGYRCAYVSGEIKLSSEHQSYKWINKNNYKNYFKSGFTDALKAYFEGLEDVDVKHNANLSKLSHKALEGNSYFADWARRASAEPDKVYIEILGKLGDLKVQKSWDVFAKIYNEDTPDSVFYGAVKFVDQILRSQGVGRADLTTDVACGTGAVSRILTSFGYRNIVAFDRSRAMLSEAFRLCSHMPSIRIMEAEIEEVSLEPCSKAMVWIDFSSNFALSKDELSKWLNNLLANLTEGGVLLFDVRTRTGWDVDFFKQKVTAYETENFQRLWVNLPDYEKGQITFDIFIRVKDRSGEWLPWEREQMSERMWSLSEIKEIVKGLKLAELVNIYNDNFIMYKDDHVEPGLAYLVLRKNK